MNRSMRNRVSRSTSSFFFVQHSRSSGLSFVLRGHFLKSLVLQTCFKDACWIAIPSALLATLLKLLDHNLKLDFLIQAMPESSVYNGFSAIMGTLIVFRTVQALSQYKEGASLVYQIMGSWYASASTLIAFTRGSKALEVAVYDFQHTVIRLFSLLSVLCLAELENKNPNAHKQAVCFDIIDTINLDLGTLDSIKNSSCKVEVVAQHIQCMIVDAMSSGILSVPAPVITGAFQDLGDGLMKFHTALNIAHVSIPLPFASVTDGLLAIHAIFTPMYMCLFTQSPAGAFSYTLILVLLFWSFNFLATELDNPFGADENDLPVGKLQFELNEQLQSLFHLSTKPTPRTAQHALHKRNTKMMRITQATQGCDNSLKYTISDFFNKIYEEAEVVQGTRTSTLSQGFADVCENSTDALEVTKVESTAVTYQSQEFHGTWEQSTDRPSWELLVLPQRHQLEQGGTLMVQPDSLGSTRQEVHEEAALAALHQEEQGYRGNCPVQGHQTEPVDGTVHAGAKSFGTSGDCFRPLFRDHDSKMSPATPSLMTSRTTARRPSPRVIASRSLLAVRSMMPMPPIGSRQDEPMRTPRGFTPRTPSSRKR